MNLKQLKPKKFNRFYCEENEIHSHDEVGNCIPLHTYEYCTDCHGLCQCDGDYED
jgi:hypothetical protein